MSDGRISLLILTGPVGVGKTKVSDAISEMLSVKNVPNAVIDMDSLRWAYPRPKDDPFNTALGIKNLAAIWKNYAEIGVSHLVIPNVIESKEEILDIQKAVPGSEATTICLTASVDTLHKRLNNREVGDSLDWHQNRASELNEKFKTYNFVDDTIDTENKTLDEVAQEVSLKWLSTERI